MISYVMTGQMYDMKRFILFTLISILVSFTAQSQGLLIGALFMSNASAAVFLGPISSVPIMLFGGFFVRLTTIPSYLKIFGYTSYLRYSFELMLMSIYGLNRCILDPEMLKQNISSKPEWIDMATMVLGDDTEQVVESFSKAMGGVYDPNNGYKYQSTILTQFNVNEDYFYPYFFILFAFIFVIRVVTYFIVVQKIR